MKKIIKAIALMIGLIIGDFYYRTYQKRTKRLSVPKLYIMMRHDLVDLSPGKAMAQACHAANQFTHSIDKGSKATKQFIEWLKQGKGFGTTIVLSASKNEIEQMIPLAASEGYECGFTFDTSYPIGGAAGEVFTVNALTCAYIFVGSYSDSYETEIRLKSLPLHP